jgi:hypothetical protein
MIVDAGEFGIIKLLVNNPKKGKEQLVKNGFTISEADVMVIRKEYAMPDDILLMAKRLKESNINVQYAYGFSSKETLIVLKTNDDTKAVKTLQT